MSQSCVAVPVSSNSVARSCDCLAHRFGNADARADREPRYPSDVTDAEWALSATTVNGPEPFFSELCRLPGLGADGGGARPRHPDASTCRPTGKAQFSGLTGVLTPLRAVVRNAMPVPAWLEGRSGPPEGYCHRQLVDAVRYLVAAAIATNSSWIDQVERWFGFLSDQMIRRGAHKNVQALKADIRAWIKDWNENPKPFTWNQNRRRDPGLPARFWRRISGAGH